MFRVTSVDFEVAQSGIQPRRDLLVSVVCYPYAIQKRRDAQKADVTEQDVDTFVVVGTLATPQ